MESLKQSFVKLNPRIMVKNPIMFTVEVATLIMLVVTLYSATHTSQGSFVYNLWVFVILFLTLLFANFAEAIAEARGKAQADSLRKTREETPAKLIVDGKVKTVSSSQLKKGDVFECEAGDVIPADGEIIEDWLPLMRVPLPVSLLRLSAKPEATRAPLPEVPKCCQTISK